MKQGEFKTRVIWCRDRAMEVAVTFAVKGTLYVSAIHQATLVASPDGAISWRTLAPLVAISLLLVLGPALLRRLRPAAEPAPAPVEPA